MSAPTSNTYHTVERCIRFYPVTGTYIATITRYDPTAAAGSRTHLRSGLQSIEAARAARTELETLHPPRSPGRRKPRP